MSRSLGPYHTLNELIGRKVVISDLLQALSKIPRSDVLRCIAGLSAVLERGENTGYQQQVRLLYEITPPALAKQIEASLKNLDVPFGSLFHRRQIWFVLQMAVLTCKDDSTLEHDDKTLKEIGTCCLMANDLLKAVEIVQFKVPEDGKDALSSFMTVLIANAEISFGSEVIARAQLFWLEMPDDESVKKAAKRYGLTKPLSQAFEEAHGIPLREFILYVIILYHKFAEGSLQQPPAALMYDSSKAFQDYFSQEHIAKAVKLLSTTPDDLAARLMGSPRQSWATDSTALIKTPLLQMSENQYVCPDLHMLRAFFIQGIFELLMQAVDPGKLKQYLGALFERYIERLMQSFAPTSTVLVNTYFSSIEFVSEDDEEAGDGLLLWPSHAVLLECKSNMLTPRQRYAMNAEDTKKGIDDQIATFAKFGDKKGSKGRKGIGQLAYNLYRIFKGDPVKHKGKPIDLSGVKKFYPAVVIYDEGMANHGVRLHLQLRMIEWFDEMKVDHSRVGHVLLFTIRDMEFFEMLSHKIGAERLMKDYVDYVEKNPRSLDSMFHEYVLIRYKEASECTGLMNDTIHRVLHSAQDEMKARKAQHAKK